MKHINKLIQTSSDPIAEARKDKRFFWYSKEARVAVRLAAEVYEKRKQRGWTQARLATEIETTQKVISNIENGDVDIGIGLLKRLVDGLSFSDNDLGVVFESCYVISLQNNTASAKLPNKFENSQTKYSIVNNYTYATNQR